MSNVSRKRNCFDSQLSAVGVDSCGKNLQDVAKTWWEEAANGAAPRIT